MIKVGLIGGGGIASAHIRGYAEHADRIAVTAVADAVPETVERRAAELGAQGFADYRQMITEADIDAVDICLPHHLHKDAIVAAAQAGKHILCEKPLCLSPAEAVEVQEAVAAAGVTLMCAHNQLFLPAVAAAKAVLDSGRLGRVYEVRTTDCFYNDFDPANMGWRASAATSGGGELIDTGYHPTYLMLHLAGCGPGGGGGDAVHPPADLRRGRGLRAGGGPVRERGDRARSGPAGRTTRRRSPSGSPWSPRTAPCTATGPACTSATAAGRPPRRPTTRSTPSSPRSATSPTA